MPRPTTEQTRTAAFHLFFAQSAWNMKAGLLAWPPPPMPAPEPRAARRCDSLRAEDRLYAAEIKRREH